MMPDPSALLRWRRRGFAVLCLAFCLSTSGCGLLYNEFTWLDRAPPRDDAAAERLASP